MLMVMAGAGMVLSLALSPLEWKVQPVMVFVLIPMAMGMDGMVLKRV